MDIFELIQADHRKVESLFSEIESTDSAKKLQTLFNQLYTDLNVHAKAEELTFYPTMLNYEGTEDQVAEAEEEHTEAKELLEELKSLSPTSSEFKAKIRELKEAVQHHVEEEESEIFATISEKVGKEELKELAKEFQEAKSKLQKEMAAASR